MNNYSLMSIALAARDILSVLVTDVSRNDRHFMKRLYPFYYDQTITNGVKVGRAIERDRFILFADIESLSHPRREFNSDCGTGEINCGG
ncbi:MAG: hypothetical protein SW833_22870 [Cyanobacteriota bacterium]|nr:hypothetical protein [Cyanobacteriota bacterium]